MYHFPHARLGYVRFSFFDCILIGGTQDRRANASSWSLRCQSKLHLLLNIRRSLEPQWLQLAEESLQLRHSAQEL